MLSRSLLRRRASSGVPAAAGSSAAPDVCLHVAGAAAEERDALWEAGGVRFHGDGDAAAAAGVQAESAADAGPESQGPSVRPPADITHV